MPWITDGNNPSFADLAAKATIQGGGGVSGFQRRQGGASQLLQVLGPEIFGYLENRQKEQRANQLLATLDAQKATAVDPSTAGTGQPGTVLSPAEAAQNAALGYSSKAQTPQMGGTDELANRIEAIKMKKLIDESTPEMIKDEHGNWVTPRQASYDLSARKTSTTVPYTLPDGNVIQVTPDTAARYMHAKVDKNDPNAGFAKAASGVGLTPDDFSNIDLTTPNAVQYVTTDEKGQPRQLSTQEADALISNKKNPFPVNAVTTVNGRQISVPYAKWKDISQRYQNLNRSTTTQQPGAVTYKNALGQGQAGITAVDVQQAATASGQSATPTPPSGGSRDVVTVRLKDGRKAIYDANTKEFIQYVE